MLCSGLLTSYLTKLMRAANCIWFCLNLFCLKAAYSVTMNFFSKKNFFLFKSFVKVE